MEFLTLDEYTNLPGDDLPYLIHRFIACKGRHMLVGPPKEGKSFLGIQIGLAVAKGEPFMGRPSVQGKVLYIQYDTPHVVWLDRMKQLRRAGVTFHENFIVPHPETARAKIDVCKEEDRQYLIDMLAEVQPQLVIIDTYRKLYRGDENNSSLGVEVFDYLNEIFKDTAVIYIHHTKKLSPPPGQKIQARIEPRDAARGSNFAAGEVEAIYLLYGKRFVSDCRFDEPFDYACQMDKITKQWIFPDLASLPKMEASIRRIWNGKSWATWADFYRHIAHTIVDVPDHLMNRLEAELWQTS